MDVKLHISSILSRKLKAEGHMVISKFIIKKKLYDNSMYYVCYASRYKLMHEASNVPFH